MSLQVKSRDLKACGMKESRASLFPDDTGPCLCLSGTFGCVVLWSVFRGYVLCTGLCS